MYPPTVVPAEERRDCSVGAAPDAGVAVEADVRDSAATRSATGSSTLHHCLEEEIVARAGSTHRQHSAWAVREVSPPRNSQEGAAFVFHHCPQRWPMRGHFGTLLDLRRAYS
jgi:hypothetical protein